MTGRRHVVALRTAEPRTIAAVHARLALGTVPREFRRYLDRVYEAARAGTVQLDGQNVFLYHAVPNHPRQIDVAFGVGITAPFLPVGDVTPTHLPVGEVATTTHWGSYAGLGDAHAAIDEWCRVNDRRRAGSSWEVYGHWTEDEASLRTDVFYLLEPAARTA